MAWTNRINTRNYAIGTFINLGFAIYAGLPGILSTIALVFVVVSAVLNHYFTVKALSGLITGLAVSGRRGAKILFYMVFKMAFLVSGFAFLMLYAPNAVLQGLVVYIFQLIILGLSIKNIGKFFKKGSIQ
jgi:hypothetical protein